VAPAYPGAVATTAVIFGGPSPEHDVSILTGLQAARALAGTSPTPPLALYWSKTGDWFSVDPLLEAEDFADGVPKASSALRLLAGPGGGFVAAGRGRWGRDRPLEIEVAVNCCHGGPGEDGTLQAALDLAGVAYTGPTLAGAALGMDKLAFGDLASAAGLPVLPRTLLSPDTDELPAGGPYIVKPRFGGSSIGIDVVENLETARARLSANPHLRQGAVVEPYRPDLVDIQVALRTWPGLSLSAIERPVRTRASAEIYGYADKYVGGEGMASAPRELPAKLSPSLEERVRAAAEVAARLCGVRGVARLDFLCGLDSEELFVSELNTVPGSLAKHLWVDPEVPLPQLLADLIAEARARPSAQHTSMGADGSVLRSAAAIAAKLG
jgi:D-alanine-D-alanine ligase